MPLRAPLTSRLLSLLNEQLNGKLEWIHFGLSMNDEEKREEPAESTGQWKLSAL